MLDEALTYFRTLAPSDRRAILALLAPDERSALERTIERKRTPRPAESAPSPNTRAYSRALRRRIDEILANTGAEVTLPARAALVAILREVGP